MWKFYALHGRSPVLVGESLHLGYMSTIFPYLFCCFLLLKKKNPVGKYLWFSCKSNPIISVFLWGWCLYTCTNVLMEHATKTLSGNLQSPLQTVGYSEQFAWAHSQQAAAEETAQPSRRECSWRASFQDRLPGTQYMFSLAMTAYC